MKKITLLCSLLLLAIYSNSQQYWNPINSGTSKRLMSISFGSSKNGYISGADSLLLKTTDGGHTWAPVAFTGINFSIAVRDIVNINFIDTNIGYAVASNFVFPLYQGELYKTVDGGTTWSPVATGANIAAYRTFFFDEHNGYEIGSAFFSGHTLVKLDSGTWGNYKTFTFDASNFLYAIDFYDTSMGIVGGALGYVYRTFDAGITWDTVKTIIDSTINALKFLNDSTIIGATDHTGGAIIISTDTGKTWQLDIWSQSFFYPYLKSLAISKKDSFITVGKPSNMPNVGLILWNDTVISSASAPHPLNEVTMRDDSVAFAVGDSGLIMSNLAGPLNINASPVNERGLKVYPNPATNNVIVESATAHKVRVYNITGRLVSEEAGKQQRNIIDLSGEARGIYIIEAELEGGERVHEKVLLK